MEAVEHGFDWDKRAIYVIERSACGGSSSQEGLQRTQAEQLWGMLEYLTLELGGG